MPDSVLSMFFYVYVVMLMSSYVYNLTGYELLFSTF